MDMGGTYDSPTPSYLRPSYGQALTASDPVTPPITYAQNGWVKGNDGNPFEYVEVFAGASEIEIGFSGLPMGPVGGAALMERPNYGNPYHQGDMASVSGQAEQSFPNNEAPYQQPIHGYQGPNPIYMPVPPLQTYQPPSEETDSIDKLKRSVDVIREQGAGLRALRLLDEASNQDPYAEPEDDRPRRSIAQTFLHKVKKEIVKNKKAKQVRKQMVLGYTKSSIQTLAETSRPDTTVRKGCDPDLISDKCQIDFERQRGAELKALNLLNSNLF
jgi:hypothetical protein